jgi:hypothetical protein
MSITPRLYPWGKSARYQLDRRLGEPQSRSGRREEKNILDPTGTGTPTPHAACSQLLYRLSYPGSEGQIMVPLGLWTSSIAANATSINGRGNATCQLLHRLNYPIHPPSIALPSQLLKLGADQYIISCT